MQENYENRWSEFGVFSWRWGESEDEIPIRTFKIVLIFIARNCLLSIIIDRNCLLSIIIDKKNYRFLPKCMKSKHGPQWQLK